MSIQSEISRIKQAKTNIVAAIKDKGVTVPSKTSLSEMADYIQTISQGEGQVGPQWVELLSQETFPFPYTNDIHWIPGADTDCIYYSNNGMDYAEISVPMMVHSIVTDGTTILLLPSYGGEYMCSKDNGKSWNIVQLDRETAWAQECRLAYWFNKNFIIITSSLDYLGHSILTSSDGMNWTVVIDNIGEVSAIGVNENQIMVAAGEKIYYSLDGNTWLPVEYDFYKGSIRELTYINNMWFALTYKGTLYYSADSITWNETVISNRTISDITYYNNATWFVSTDEGVFKSSDLKDWTLVADGGFWGIKSIKERIIFIDSNNVYYSEDGENWNPIKIYPKYLDKISGWKLSPFSIKTKGSTFYIYCYPGLFMSW